MKPLLCPEQTARADERFSGSGFLSSMISNIAMLTPSGFPFPPSAPASASAALVRTARLLKLLTLLRSRQPKERLTREMLAEACECSVRTVQRDLNILCRYTPAEYDPLQNTYTLPDTGWTYPIADWTLADALALAVARGRLLAPGLPETDALSVALDKATAGLSPELQGFLRRIAAVVQPAPPSRDLSGAPLTELAEAAAERQTVEVDYESRRSGRSLRLINPYLLEPREGRTDLHGWCHRNRQILTFAADRVRAVRPTEATFTVQEEAWAAFVGARGVLNGLRGGEDVEVDVRFAPPVAPYALDKGWPDTLSVTEEADGSARLVGAVVGLDGLIPELLRWRRHAQVLGGPVLRARMVEEVQAMADLYADKDSI